MSGLDIDADFISILQVQSSSQYKYLYKSLCDYARQLQKPVSNVDDVYVL